MKRAVQRKSVIEHVYPDWIKSKILEWLTEEDERLKACRIMGHYWKRIGNWEFEGIARSVSLCNKCGYEKIR